LKDFIDHSGESIHFSQRPQPNPDLIDEDVERRVASMRKVVDLGRVVRDRKGIQLKRPLAEMVVVPRNAQFLDDVRSLEEYITAELNVEKVVISQDRQKYGVRLKAKPNYQLLGARLRGDQKKVTDYLRKEISEDELERFSRTGRLTIHGYELTPQEVEVVPSAMERGADEDWATADGSECVVMLNIREDADLIAKGLAREFVNRVQKLRKAAKLDSIDSAVVYCTISPDGSAMASALATHIDWVQQSTRTPIFFAAVPEHMEVRVEKEDTIDGDTVKLLLVIAGGGGRAGELLGT